MKQVVANIRWYVNICRLIFAGMWIFASKYSHECEIRLEFCEYLSINEYFEANIRQYEKILSEYSLWSECSVQHVYFASNWISVYEAIMKRMMRINSVCEFTKTCEYEANKIHIIRLDSLRRE